MARSMLLSASATDNEPFAAIRIPDGHGAHGGPHIPEEKTRRHGQFESGPPFLSTVSHGRAFAEAYNAAQ
ncbi:MAG: hypothetical protein L6R41_002113 [Letrouitia leprolyta]|nr:MAG: hypothetical protein L6R41_002113 [Letrouitia leprolyta]